MIKVTIDDVITEFSTAEEAFCVFQMWDDFPGCTKIGIKAPIEYQMEFSGLVDDYVFWKSKTSQD